ncbi:hypothetical protein ACFE04_013358 [Oxalis oulophora]
MHRSTNGLIGKAVFLSKRILDAEEYTILALDMEGTMIHASCRGGKQLKVESFRSRYESVFFDVIDYKGELYRGFSYEFVYKYDYLYKCKRMYHLGKWIRNHEGCHLKKKNNELFFVSPQGNGLYVVAKEDNHLNGEACQPCRRFHIEVYELNEETDAFEEVKSLGESAFFLCDNSFAIPIDNSNSEFRRGCIYFIDKKLPSVKNPPLWAFDSENGYCWRIPSSDDETTS